MLPSLRPPQVISLIIYVFALCHDRYNHRGQRQRAWSCHAIWKGSVGEVRSSHEQPGVRWLHQLRLAGLGAGLHFCCISVNDAHISHASSSWFQTPLPCDYVFYIHSITGNIPDRMGYRRVIDFREASSTGNCFAKASPYAY